MKKRVLMNMCNNVYRVVICTEDWSQGDLELMCQYGEPEINVGGEIVYLFSDGSSSDDGSPYIDDASIMTKTFGDEFVRVVHGFPYARGFDVRDYRSVDEAIAVGKAWKEEIVKRIDSAIMGLRSKTTPMPTEEIIETYR